VDGSDALADPAALELRRGRHHIDHEASSGLRGVHGDVEDDDSPGALVNAMSTELHRAGPISAHWAVHHVCLLPS